MLATVLAAITALVRCLLVVSAQPGSGAAETRFLYPLCEKRLGDNARASPITGRQRRTDHYYSDKGQQSIQDQQQLTYPRMFCAVATWVGVVAFRQVIAVGGVLLSHAQNITSTLYNKKTGAVVAPAL